MLVRFIITKKLQVTLNFTFLDERLNLYFLVQPTLLICVLLKHLMFLYSVDAVLM